LAVWFPPDRNCGLPGGVAGRSVEGCVGRGDLNRPRRVKRALEKHVFLQPPNGRVACKGDVRCMIIIGDSFAGEGMRRPYSS